MIITIYKIPNCIYCDKAVLLAQLNKYEVVERDVRALSKAQWKAKIGHIPKTAPQIFIGPDHIGGYDDLERYFEGV